jgi:hypothetical protein
MCRVENWSVRTLRDKINGMLNERTALSRASEELAEQEIADLRAGVASPTGSPCPRRSLTSYGEHLPSLHLLALAPCRLGRQGARTCKGREDVFAGHAPMPPLALENWPPLTKPRRAAAVMEVLAIVLRGAKGHC